MCIYIYMYGIMVFIYKIIRLILQPLTFHYIYIYISGQIVLLPEETTLIIFKQNQFTEKNLVESDDIIISSIFFC